MKRIISVLLTVIIISFLTACNVDFLKDPQKEDEQVCTAHVDSDDDLKCDECGYDFDDGEEIPEATSVNFNIESKVGNDYYASFSFYKGQSFDFSSVLSEYVEIDGVKWESDCDGISSVNAGTALANEYGKTKLHATAKDGTKFEISVSVNVYVNKSGFDITPTADTKIYYVLQEREAYSIIDDAIASHKSRITLDFSALGNAYTPFYDFDFQHEFGNHVSLTKKYSEDAPQVLYIEFQYNVDAATTYIEGSANDRYSSVTNANMALRSSAKSSKYKRADDFSDFAIYNSNAGTKSVVNSEELWLALEYNYLPVFPVKYTKAESFFEQAKTILREIITEDMTEYEKVLAIFDYLVDEIEYDYATFNNISKSNPVTDTCYYLEGVFERSKAVCDGKSKAFVLFCRIEGIECLRDFGSSKTLSAGHAWNYVKLGGRWYLVDTTNSDSPQAMTSSMGTFFGKNVEITTYGTFLTSVTYHKPTYVYSSIHELTVQDSFSDISTNVLGVSPSGKYYDFKISTDSELKKLLTDLYALGLDECVLVVSLTRNVRWNSVLDELNRTLGTVYEYNAYDGTIGDTAICYIALKKAK